MNDLPYRPNVGAALFNAEGRVFIGLRTGLPEGTPLTWQMPQGGIDPGEDPAQAVLRELREEVGTPAFAGGFAGSGRNGSPCGFGVPIPTSPWTAIPTPSFPIGAGRRLLSCRI